MTKIISICRTTTAATFCDALESLLTLFTCIVNYIYNYYTVLLFSDYDRFIDHPLFQIQHQSVLFYEIKTFSQLFSLRF